MQIIDKPKQHRLPFSLSRKIVSKHQTAQLPEIDFSGLSGRKKMQSSSHKRLEYEFNIDKNNFRPQVRTVLSKEITFQQTHNKDNDSLQFLLQKIKEPTKTLNFLNPRLKFLMESVRDIFGEDYPVKDRDVIVIEGNITKKCYLFFTHSKFRPFSLCCRVIIYLKLADFHENDFLKSEQRNSIEGKDNEKFLRTYFICSKCQKSVLKMTGVSRTKIRQNFARDKWERAKSKEQSQMQIERKKINLSVMIASGKFRKLRLNEGKSDSKAKRYKYYQTNDNSVSKLPYHSGQQIKIHQRSRSKKTQQYAQHDLEKDILEK